MTTPPRLYSVAETAAALSVSASTIWRLIRSGELPSQRLRRRVLVSQAALEQYQTLPTPAVRPIRPGGLTERELLHLRSLGLKARRAG